MRGTKNYSRYLDLYKMIYDRIRVASPDQIRRARVGRGMRRTVVRFRCRMFDPARPDKAFTTDLYVMEHTGWRNLNRLISEASSEVSSEASSESSPEESLESTSEVSSGSASEAAASCREICIPWDLYKSCDEGIFNVGVCSAQEICAWAENGLDRASNEELEAFLKDYYAHCDWVALEFDPLPGDLPEEKDRDKAYRVEICRFTRRVIEALREVNQTVIIPGDVPVGEDFFTVLTGRDPRTGCGEFNLAPDAGSVVTDQFEFTHPTGPSSAVVHPTDNLSTIPDSEEDRTEGFDPHITCSVQNLSEEDVDLLDWILEETRVFNSFLDEDFPAGDEIIGHESERPGIQWLYAWDEIRAAIDRGMIRYYGKAYQDQPEIIRRRVEEEIRRYKFLTDKKAAAYFRTAVYIGEQCRRLGIPFLVRGGVNSSFIAFLTCLTEVNPLPPHYRCPDCGRVKFLRRGTVASGFDLAASGAEKKCCSFCHAEMVGDGHDIAAEFLPEFARNFEFEIPSGDARKSLVQALEARFGMNTVFGYNGDDREWISIFTGDRSVYDHTAVFRNPSGGEAKLMQSRMFLRADYISFRFMETGKMSLLHDRAQECPVDEGLPLTREELQRALSEIASGEKILEELSIRLLPDHRILRDLRPACFSALVKAYGFDFTDGAWTENPENREMAIKDWSRAVAFRDDIMDMLTRYGVPAMDAGNMAECIGSGGVKGYYAGEAFASLQQNYDLPEWFTAVLQKICGLSAKGETTARVLAVLRAMGPWV